MKNTHKYALQITIVTLIISYISLYLILFLFYENESFSRFNILFFSEIQKNLLIFIFFGIIGYFGLLYLCVYKLLISQIGKLDEHNKKLKNYNHFLAHELKTPISVVQTNLEVLKYGFDMKKIEDSFCELKNMNAIIGGLLDFSESIQRSQEKTFNLENTLKKYSGIFGQDIDVQMVNKEFNKTLTTDEILFSRVIKNLFENATKYMTGKRVLIQISQNSLMISNDIDGTFDEEELADFLQMGQSSAVLSRNGHGLGLSMIQEILQKLGFSFKISSENNMFHAKIEL